MPIASHMARRRRCASVLCRVPRRSTKSFMTTAVNALIPESMLDMPAARIPATTSPDKPTAIRGR